MHRCVQTNSIDNGDNSSGEHSPLCFDTRKAGHQDRLKLSIVTLVHDLQRGRGDGRSAVGNPNPPVLLPGRRTRKYPFSLLHRQRQRHGRKFEEDPREHPLDGGTKKRFLVSEIVPTRPGTETSGGGDITQLGIGETSLSDDPRRGVGYQIPALVMVDYLWHAITSMQ